MTDERINAYEGLFLFPQTIGADLQTAVDHIKEILAKADATLISLKKWDERRLAYEIQGNKRGVYFLVYFRAARTTLVSIERSCNLSEQLLRFMIVRADQVTQEQMESIDGTAELADEIKVRADQLTQEQMESSDGTAELADEIKLRAEKEATRIETPSAAVVSRPGDAPPAVKTEPRPGDAPPP